MRTTTYRIAFVLLVVTLAACSSGSGSSNNPPVANAGADQTTGVQVGDAVLLDGSASSDPDGDALTYSWSLTAAPTDSTATFNDPSSDKPSFVADRAGTYVAQLIVNDGKTDSAPATVSVIAVVPPPKVTITAPENLSVVTATTVTVTGTVDDPAATLTVNGEPVANVNGNYNTDVTLAEGSNTVTVVGTNSTGEGSASVKVMVNTSENPAVAITSPKPDFIAGGEFAIGVQFPATTPITVTGVIQVHTSALLPNNNKPTVTINGVPVSSADVTLNPFFSKCNLFVNPFQCWKFTGTIGLAKGEDTIAVVGTDVKNRSTTVSEFGIVDYCRIGAYDSQHSTPGYFDPGVMPLAGPNRDIQSNRCHEIDGCSAPNVAQQCADDPMQCPQGGGGTVLAKIKLGWIAPIPAEFNQAPTTFGHGAPPPDGIGNPPTEYFVHGDRSAYDVPCNRHDPCYQTCVPVAGLSDADRELAWENAWHACNDRQHREMLDVCVRAYPARCPYRITVLGADLPDPIKCARYYDEKATCSFLALLYYRGVETHYAPGSLEENLLNGQPSGLTRFKQRQQDYCAQ